MILQSFLMLPLLFQSFNLSGQWLKKKLLMFFKKKFWSVDQAKFGMVPRYLIG